MQLVIAEKPSVANSIADVLGANDRKDGYREGGGYLVSWCVGHLVELAQPDSYREEWKMWNYDSLPMIPDEWQYQVKTDTKKQFDVVKKLMNDAKVSEVVCATDAGREGELIFRLAYKMAGCSKPILRLWISSMEESAIREGFDNLKPGSEYDNLFQSALARQQADWLVGINGTRLFTVLYKSKVLKVGRVQTPTLAMLVDREAEIMNFKKTPYYTLVLDADGLSAVSDKYETEEGANKAKDSCTGNAEVVSVKREDKAFNPPKLYDLTSLQRDANKLFGFTAKQTLEYTQSLYEKKLVTYPRTDSQFLSDDMEDTAGNVIAVIKENMALTTLFEENVSPDIKRVLNSKKVTDHHAIIPTVQIAKGIDVTEAEKKVLHLIAARLLEATGDKHEYVSETVVLSCGNIEFKCNSKVVKHNGWKVYEEVLKTLFGIKKADEADSEDTEVLSGVSVEEGQSLQVKEVTVKEQFTKAPAHYTEATLLTAMEKAGAADMDDEVERKGLGTPATRADIIEKLVKDGFVKREKKQMIPTEDGMKLITVLPDVVKSPQLTADWENALVQVSRGEYSMEEFMDGIEQMVSDLVAKYEGIGESTMDNPFSSGQESLGACPKCKAAVVKGKYGPYCSGKCGMIFGRAMGATLTEKEVKSLLEGKKILVKNLRAKSGKTYDAYLEPNGIEEFSYTDKNGKEHKGSQYKFNMSFPKKKN
jgi:DNA topoisomerase-3